MSDCEVCEHEDHPVLRCPSCDRCEGGYLIFLRDDLTPAPDEDGRVTFHILP